MKIKQWTALVVVGAMGFALAGCDDADSTDGDSAEPAVERGQADEPDTSADNTEAQDETDSDASGAVDPGPEGAMTGEDGWVELHALDIPDAGTMVIRINGEEATVTDFTCNGPGVVGEDDFAIGLFAISVYGDMVAPDGRDGLFNLERRVATYEDWGATGGAGDVYDYGGQDSASVLLSAWGDDGLASNAVKVSPGDADHGGSELPLVHVAPDGAFTVHTNLEPAATGHEDAPSGDVEIAGKCSAPWSDL